MTLKQQLENLPWWTPYPVLVLAGGLLLLDAGIGPAEAITSVLAVGLELAAGAGDAVINVVPHNWVPAGLSSAIAVMEPLMMTIGVVAGVPIPALSAVAGAITILLGHRQYKK